MDRDSSLSGIRLGFESRAGHISDWDFSSSFSIRVERLCLFLETLPPSCPSLLPSVFWCNQALGAVNVTCYIKSYNFKVIILILGFYNQIKSLFWYLGWIINITLSFEEICFDFLIEFNCTRTYLALFALRSTSSSEIIFPLYINLLG